MKNLKKNSAAELKSAVNSKTNNGQENKSQEDSPLVKLYKMQLQEARRLQAKANKTNESLESLDLSYAAHENRVALAKEASEIVSVMRAKAFKAWWRRLPWDKKVAYMKERNTAKVQASFGYGAFDETAFHVDDAVANEAFALVLEGLDEVAGGKMVDFKSACKAVTAATKYVRKAGERHEGATAVAVALISLLYKQLARCLFKAGDYEELLTVFTFCNCDENRYAEVRTKVAAARREQKVFLRVSNKASVLRNRKAANAFLEMVEEDPQLRYISFVEEMEKDLKKEVQILSENTGKIFCI